MWENMIEYLKDPLLVVKVQNFFGVIYKRTSCNDSSEVIHSDRLDRENEEHDIKQHKRIPSNTSSSSQTSQSSCDTDSSAEVREEVECQISNKFWYYLFVLGTALGDEIFYATFIPFWFWNVDGAVGRRVILVWTIVMYIGTYNSHFTYICPIVGDIKWYHNIFSKDYPDYCYFGQANTRPGRLSC